MEASIRLPREVLTIAPSKPLPGSWLVVDLLWITVVINVTVRFLPTSIPLEMTDASRLFGACLPWILSL
jgi:hypothetical protein